MFRLTPLWYEGSLLENGSETIASHPTLTVVIPTFNAGPRLARVLETLMEGRNGLVGEVVIADADSIDGTRELAGGLGARVIAAPKNRGAQLAAGASAAGGDWLLFVHADTVLAPGWRDEATRFIADPSNAERAAVFRFALDDPGHAARGLEAVVSLRCRILALPYGDQALLIDRGFYQRLGGFSSLPLMEDVELVRRIGRARLAFLASAAVTSAARYRRDGYFLRPLRNVLCLTLYFLGVPPQLILRLYGGAEAS